MSDMNLLYKDAKELGILYHNNKGLTVEQIKNKIKKKGFGNIISEIKENSKNDTVIILTKNQPDDPDGISTNFDIEQALNE